MMCMDMKFRGIAEDEYFDGTPVYKTPFPIFFTSTPPVPVRKVDTLCLLCNKEFLHTPTCLIIKKKDKVKNEVRFKISGTFHTLMKPFKKLITSNVSAPMVA